MRASIMSLNSWGFSCMLADHICVVQGKVDLQRAHTPRVHWSADRGDGVLQHVQGATFANFGRPKAAASKTLN